MAADVYQVAMNAYALYGQANAMYAFDFPGLAAIDTELQQMIKSILRAPEEAVTTVTAGGTESNILAVRAAREQARARGLSGRPNIVVADSAHPSFDKACDFLDMDIVRVPLGDDFRARVELMSRRSMSTL